VACSARGAEYFNSFSAAFTARLAADGETVRAPQELMELQQGLGRMITAAWEAPAQYDTSALLPGVPSR
jgi:hypothetical protein